MTTVENCRNCAFGQSPFGKFDYRCRRHDPIHIITENGPVWVWPRVGPDYFCEGFELKDAVDKRRTQ